MTDNPNAALAEQVERCEVRVIQLILTNYPDPTYGFWLSWGVRNSLLPYHSDIQSLAILGLLNRGVIRFTDRSRQVLALCDDPKQLALYDQMLLRMAPQFDPRIAVLVASQIAEVLQTDYGLGPHGEIQAATS